MVAKDTVIGVVGAVILVAALTGVFYYEGSASGAETGANTYDVTWTTSTQDGPSTDGETQEEETTEETLTVEANNITQVRFVLTWEDDVGEPDTFNITVTSPTGETDHAQGDSGEIRSTFEGVNSLPPETTIQADSEEEAAQQAALQYTSTLGQGDWVVEITCKEAGDSDPIGTGPAVEEDDGNSWELTTEITVYEHQLELA